MRIIRYINESDVSTVAALTDENQVFVLPYQGFMELTQAASEQGTTPLKLVQHEIEGGNPLPTAVESLRLLVPIEAPEVWAAGVTYARSKEARNYEATGGKLDATTFYDKVYDAERPEIFLKSTAARTVGPNDDVYLRSDSDWQIPETELGLVIDSKGTILGYTVGNDMSCRDIEGENPLYLPQAKVWKRSCSIGPSIRLAETVKDPYTFEIACRIYRNNEKVVEGTASTGQLKRKLDELVSFLIRDNEIFDGTVLLTGTCIVPPNEFTLEDGDRIENEITNIGVLTNFVKRQ
ncbi:MULTISPECIES: fumarylacetoacetate hydrolase family protein [unclassified Paenibacillus]|uniref:fumarylacetoacetate hydrolase family protein n=1 Tax=unclassified Paenibacillus TaxID=185978 RepID=UPI001AE2F788|nr:MULTISPECIES: fumarylacetoacetate hydrolase family protein [unclassified Paenibacillus]MBP1153342.1 2-dehydro-3-deoxy-D-arabinonate dehydratase [Paenibacillus sp. PvP091]MBP1171275.1 2-dehydro-3-deoxy-D-arabinonate dehydratase [Paenibacillus sp. PvR098]MBP2442303.1 2-dehydro-3-deoxy-D-arabinonate dehydratase [Paenibacillus sp. PvP052]